MLINANVADLKYFHACLTVERDPVLILTEIDSIKKDSETSPNSVTVCPFKVSGKFEKNKMLISRLKIEKNRSSTSLSSLREACEAMSRGVTRFFFSTPS